MFFILILVHILSVIGEKQLDRILNGHVVDIQEYPYQVGIVQTHPMTGKKRIICGGSIIKPKMIFTAAHCTYARDDRYRPYLSVLVGANSLDDPDGREHRIERVVKHPLFTYSGLDNDFSVIGLEKAIDFSDKARPIGVSYDDHDVGTKGIATGWGRTETGKPSKYLRMAELTVEDRDKCQTYFPRAFHPVITRNMICVKPSHSTTYFGDSGGPLVVDGKLVGLVSFGRPLAPGKKTTVFTHVKNFVDFAEEALSSTDDDDHDY